MNKYKNIIWGITFIIVGLIVGLNTLEITNINIFFDGWWTLFIIIPCIIGLLNEKDKTGNLIGLLVGISLLLATQNIIDFKLLWKLILPGILIAVGISFIFKEYFSKEINKKIKKLNEKKLDNDYYATFSYQDLIFNEEKFKGANLSVVFGAIKLDLRNAIIESDVVLNISSTFGGVDILVPENVNIKIKSTPIFGGVSDKYNRKDNTKAHTIFINATCVFGGVEIK